MATSVSSSSVSSDNSTVLIFKAITTFINDLHTEFGSKYKSITLYHRLLEKTGIMHTGPILKHIDCFRSFFTANKEMMETQDVSKIVQSQVSYSERVYVDIANIMKSADKECVVIIWQHLLTIWGLIDPTSQAKQTLKEMMKNEDNKEANFLNNIIEKVESSIDPSKVSGSNPMEMVSSLMQSGVFNELISGMQGGLEDGSLDMNKLMGSVQGMMTKMSPDGQIPPEISNMMGMMAPMLANMGKK
jgi:hypothetical protein